MSSPCCLLTEDQLLCDVCLEVFSEPVSLPCGHTFCRACVEQHWEDSVQHHCPTCKEIFSAPPQLRTNRFISDVSLLFRGAQRNPQLAKGGDISCDVCSEPKLRAFKSCLVCLTSFCETHLKPHLSVSRLKQHQLSEPTENLEARICPRHQKPLELFCRTDQSCGCMLCPVQDHKSHDIGLLRDQGRRQGLVDTLEEGQKAAETQARNLVQELEQEICQLLDRQAELERLHATKDHLLFLQNLRTLSPLAATAATDWSGVSLNLPIARGGAEVGGGAAAPHAGPGHGDAAGGGGAYPPAAVQRGRDAGPQHGAFGAAAVGGREAFASGSFYFEVQVEGKSRWTVGVAKASIQRKGVVPLCPANGHWSVWLKNGNQYAALVGTPRALSPRSRPRRVGVFVDFLRGLVSFYDGDTAERLHSFTGCSFTEELLPFFSPGLNHDGVNSAPLVIVQL
ncbi:unnamed protein product, partial [Tetraodon nigroviridis]